MKQKKRHMAPGVDGPKRPIGDGGHLPGTGTRARCQPESETGRYAQRIIYFHIATAWVGFLAFFVTFIGGIGYLRTGERKWDIVALSSAEIGTVFMLGVLVSGSIWAKPAWGVWWVWDERLTISLIQFLVYVGYLMLRSAVEDPLQAGAFRRRVWDRGLYLGPHQFHRHPHVAHPAPLDVRH